MKKIIKLLAAIVLAQGAGIIGSLATYPSIPTWYANLNKPVLSPPNWIFAPVWITLFTLMGIALFLIWESKEKDTVLKREAIIIFFIQLALNSLWSIIFFGLKNPALALLEIVILWLAILFTIIKFWKINKTSGMLLIPYLLWVSFAAYLNFGVMVLN